MERELLYRQAVLKLLLNQHIQAILDHQVAASSEVCMHSLYLSIFFH